MSYFTKFPFIKDYEIDGKRLTLLDLTRRTRVSTDSINNTSNYIEYSIKNETPEILADRMYDDVNMAWVILLFNQIFDVFSEWPLDSNSFEQFVSEKYDSSLYDVHHYVSAASNAIVDESHPLYDRIPVTNYEYEIEVNDNKRLIKVPTLEAAQQIKKQHKALVKR